MVSLDESFIIESDDLTIIYLSPPFVLYVGLKSHDHIYSRTALHFPNNTEFKKSVKLEERCAQNLPEDSFL